MVILRILTNAVIMVADEPPRHRDFLLSFTGASSADSLDGGLRIELPRGAIEVLAPDAYEAQYRYEAPATGGGARLAAMRFFGADAPPAAVLGAGLLFIRQD